MPNKAKSRETKEKSSADEKVTEEEEEEEDEEYVTEDAEEEDDDDDNTRSESSSRVGSNPDEPPEVDEGEEGYRPGGYHRVALNDVLGEKWRVELKLGWGHFSTVWLVRNGEGTAAALKVQKSASNYTAAAKDEIKLLKACLSANDTVYSGKRFVVRLFDSFTHEGPHGNHMVMVFEVLGDNLLSLVDFYQYKGIPLYLVRQITWQVCAGLDFLHRQAKIIHCDLKLENILIAGMSSDFARKVAQGMPCVVTMRLDGAQNGAVSHENSPVSSKKKEATIRSKIAALESLCKNQKGSSRRHTRRKIERLQDQLRELTIDPQTHSSAASATPKPAALMETMEDDLDDLQGEWKVVSSAKHASSRSAIHPNETKARLVSEKELCDIGNELYRRNLEFPDFPNVAPLRHLGTTPRSPARPSPPRSARSGERTPPKSSRSSRQTSPRSPPSLAMKALNLEQSDEDKVACVILSEDVVQRLVKQNEATITGTQVLIAFQRSNIKCTLIELLRPVDDSSIRKGLREGQAEELGVVSGARRSTSKTRHDLASNVLYSITCSTVNKLAVLEMLEERLGVVFLFYPRPLAGVKESTTLGVSKQAALISPDVRPRPMHLRMMPQLPPPLPKFIGDDLGITTPVDITVKIVDLGNACWTHKHFSDDIQTRQYRSPEVILGDTYDCSADVWSMGCIVFELLTGDFLFDPSSGKDYSRDEDHLALITELIGPMPKAQLRGTKRKQFYDDNGEFLHIKDLHTSSIEALLMKNYKFQEATAKKVASFLMPCLTWDATKRVTAEGCLNHPFLVGLVG